MKPECLFAGKSPLLVETNAKSLTTIEFKILSCL